MDAIERFKQRSTNPTASDKYGPLADWEVDYRKIQLAILEEMTLIRKALEDAVRAGHERLFAAVEQAE